MRPQARRPRNRARSAVAACAARRVSARRCYSMRRSTYTARVGRVAAAASRPNWFSGIAKAVASVLVFAALLCASQPASAQFIQQGSPLIGTGVVGSYDDQGFSVALSADGNTLIVGAAYDNAETGAAWVFVRSGGVWTQQAKLVGTGAVGP